jgi:DNA-binding MarR family transcriptional regulator
MPLAVCACPTLRALDRLTEIRYVSPPTVRTMPSSSDKRRQAEQMADLTFELLEHCQEKRERIAEELQLTVAEFKLFRAFRTDNVLSVNELAERLGLSPSRLTRIIDGLEGKRFVRRAISKRDRRVMDISLTDQGRVVQKQLEDTFVRTHEDIIRLLPSGTTEGVLLAITKLRDAMKEWVKH